MDNPKEWIETFHKIKDLGVNVSIDDFGTGYSSLAYLKKLPIDKLKIDQSFVRHLSDDDKAIAKAVIALAHSLNLKIIAEGVEKKEQKEFLINNGCVNIQGYYYSRPISAKEMGILLSDGFKDKML
jgi:EAL domain-containing protein (putative c-di-GMP-specific phosphodiesterase class I)